MWLLIILVGCLFLVFDIALLKKRSAELYGRFFYFPTWEIGLVGVFLFLALITSLLPAGEAGRYILEASFFLLLAIYLLRRRDLLSVSLLDAVDPVALVPTEDDQKLELALSTFSIIGLWSLCMVGASIYIDLAASSFLKDDDELMGTLLLSEISVVILIVLIYRVVRGLKNLRFSEVLGLETKGVGWMRLWALPASFALVYAIVTSWILEARPIQPMTPLQEMLNSTSSIGVLLFFVGTAILTAPFFEEVIFRGFLFYVLRPFKGVMFAVLFVALIFGVMHVDQYWGDWDAILVVGLFGLALTLLRAWTGSSVPGMIAHYVYNTTLVVLPVVVAIVANPVYFDYQLNYYRLNDQQKEERLLASIKENPRFGDSYNDLAWLYSDKDIYLDRALTLIDQAIELEPENYAFLDTKAEVLFKMNRVPEAIAIADGLVKKYPNDEYLRGQLKKFQEDAGGKKAIDI